jgi:hypothetical protein
MFADQILFPAFQCGRLYILGTPFLHVSALHQREAYQHFAKKEFSRFWLVGPKEMSPHLRIGLALAPHIRMTPGAETVSVVFSHPFHSVSERLPAENGRLFFVALFGRTRTCDSLSFNLFLRHVVSHSDLAWGRHQIRSLFKSFADLRIQTHE